LTDFGQSPESHLRVRNQAGEVTVLLRRHHFDLVHGPRPERAVGGMS
jgi:hypothetical protein